MSETDANKYKALEAKLEEVQASQSQLRMDFFVATMSILVVLFILIFMAISTNWAFDKWDKRINPKYKEYPTGPSISTPIVPIALLPTRLGPRVMKRFNSGEVMRAGDLLQSDNGEYELILGDDGNLVFYRYKQYEPKRVIWQSHTGTIGPSRPFSLLLKPDNPHLTLLNGEGQVRWTFSFDLDAKPNPQALAVKICDGQLTAFRVVQGEVVCP